MDNRAIAQSFAMIYHKLMNEIKAKKLKDIAKRTIKIIEMLEAGNTVQEIVEKLGCNRQLADYYKGQLNEKEEG